MKIVSYAQAKEYLESFIRPILFKKITMIDGVEIDPLDRFRILLSLLNNPHKKFKAVHVSGTSGKGSTSYLISQILTQAGYKTGLAISPHLERITERMQLNGKEIPEKDFIGLTNEVRKAAERMKQLPVGEPSYFELLLAITFLYFAREKVDIAVVEVGIEGKYDATLVVDPLVTVLTNISLDHTHILGSSVESITKEAVSIIRNGIPLVSDVREASLKKIIRKKAEVAEAPVIFLDEAVRIVNVVSSYEGSVFTYKSEALVLQDVSLSLLGEYQIVNAACAIRACEVLMHKELNVTPLDIREALANASFPGRFEKISAPGMTYPLFLDGAHNPAKIDAFLSSLKKFYPKEKKIFLVAFKKDKDTKKLLKKILPMAEKIIVTEFLSTTDLSMRAATSIDVIKKVVTKFSTKEEFHFFSSSRKALDLAKKLARENNALLIVTGSLYLVGEIRSLLKD